MTLQNLVLPIEDIMKENKLKNLQIILMSLFMLLSMQSAYAAIDVLIVYTPKVRFEIGGTSTFAMRTLSNKIVNDINLTYQNSGLTTRTRFLHAREINYVETSTSTSTTPAIANDLLRLIKTGDGYLETITDPTTGLRKMYGA